MNNFALASFTLWKREMVRFFRQRSRVIGALGPPALFWLLIGSGLGNSFHMASSVPTAGANYLQYFFPGTVLLIVLFTSIFSTISLIEDRHQGFLQSVLVAPLARESLVLGKICGGATLAVVQALAFLLFAPLVGFSISLGGAFYLLLMLTLCAIGLTGMGFVMAWRLDSVQGFHAVMNLFLMPMWLLSGALFPSAGAPLWLRVLMHLNPLTYGLIAFQQTLRIDGVPLSAAGPHPIVCFMILGGFAALMIVGSVRMVRRA
jgi:ABC-2 type transport system permease protein